MLRLYLTLFWPLINLKLLVNVTLELVNFTPYHALSLIFFIVRIVFALLTKRIIYGREKTWEAVKNYEIQVVENFFISKI